MKENYIWADHYPQLPVNNTYRLRLEATYEVEFPFTNKFV